MTDDDKRQIALAGAIKIIVNTTFGAAQPVKVVELATAIYEFLNPSKAGIWEGKRTRRKARG